MKMWKTYTAEYHSDIKQGIQSFASNVETTGGHCALWSKPERER